MLLAGAALADTGDALIVTGDGVNVRAGPSEDAAIRMRVHSGQQVIELQREGSWVRAEIAGTDGQEGWIHSSLLAEPAEEADQAETEPPEPAEDPRTAAPSREAGGGIAGAERAAPDRAGRRPGSRSRRARALSRDRELPQRARERARRRRPVRRGQARPRRRDAGGATEAWSSLPPAGRQSYANTLLDRWAATKVSAGPAILQIVDPSGEVVMEKTEP